MFSALPQQRTSSERSPEECSDILWKHYPHVAEFIIGRRFAPTRWLMRAGAGYINAEPGSPRWGIQDDVFLPIGSTRCAREGAGSNRSAKYCVSWPTRPSRNSMMLTA
jgi:hypothetical protein